MIKLADGSDVYSKKRLKQKLQERYTNYIFFANVEGRDDVIRFRNMAEYIVSKQRDIKGNDAECEAERIVTTAETGVMPIISNERISQSM